MAEEAITKAPPVKSNPFFEAMQKVNKEVEKVHLDTSLSEEEKEKRKTELLENFEKKRKIPEKE